LGIELETLQRNALARFDTAIGKDEKIPAAPHGKRTLDPANVDADKVTFYDRVDSNVVAEWLKNVLDDISFARLLLKKTVFSFVDAATGTVSFDGPLMLKIALSKLDPNVVVGIELLRQKLETIRLHTFKNNVDEMCDEIEGIMKQIEGSDKHCESIRRYTITALSSGPNAKFNMFIDRLNDDIESQTGANKAMEWRDIIDAARVKYNNMNSLSQWDTVDPRDAKLLALATQVETLKSNQSSSGKSWKGEGAGNSDKIGGVAKWRTIKDKGESCEWNGTTWYWCTKHVHPNGAFNGLYCTHKPEDHDEWKANRNAWKKDKDKKDGNPTESRTKSLSVSQKLKSVLCTKLMLSDEDAEEICKDCQVN
jgi:flagellar biosynthesis chaperone FliJ